VAVTMVIPLTPLAGSLGFAGLSPALYGAILAVVVLYLLSAEVAKWLFYRSERRREGSQGRPGPPGLPALSGQVPSAISQSG
jgi:uncharacterized protein (DUF2062 family)